MSALYFLIPMSIVIVAGALWAFLWSLKRGQFEDMESPAHRIIIEDREDQSRLDEQK
jgi:cbb3-type cytochrome oxidase maturation protein